MDLFEALWLDAIGFAGIPRYSLGFVGVQSDSLAILRIRDESPRIPMDFQFSHNSLSHKAELQAATQGLKCATRAVEKHVLQRFATQLLCDLTGFELQ